VPEHQRERQLEATIGVCRCGLDRVTMTDRVGRFDLELLDLEHVGARAMTPDALAAAAVHLRALAIDLEHLRFLQLERRRRLTEGVTNRPTIGYFRRLLMG